MAFFRHLHRHNMITLGKYYHLYEAYEDYSRMRFHLNQRYGIHVEVNVLQYCRICGLRGIENLSDRFFDAGSPSLADYIKELEAQDVVSEKTIEVKYQDTVRCLKQINQ